MYKVFIRTWWKESKGWPNGLEPCAGRKHILGKVPTEALAREWCYKWNENHNPGRLSRKAEYMEV